MHPELKRNEKPRFIWHFGIDENQARLALTPSRDNCLCRVRTSNRNLWICNLTANGCKYFIAKLDQKNRYRNRCQCIRLTNTSFCRAHAAVVQKRKMSIGKHNDSRVNPMLSAWQFWWITKRLTKSTKLEFRLIKSKIARERCSDLVHQVRCNGRYQDQTPGVGPSILFLNAKRRAPGRYSENSRAEFDQPETRYPIDMHIWMAGYREHCHNSFAHRRDTDSLLTCRKACSGKSVKMSQAATSQLARRRLIYEFACSIAFFLSCRVGESFQVTSFHSRKVRIGIPDFEFSFPQIVCC